MGFWIFLFIMVLICPITMIGFGKLFMKYTPTNINNVFGYRTHMSSINGDTWEFAHKYFGRIWYFSGITLLIPSILAFLFVFGKDKDFVENVGMVVQTVQIIVMLATIFPTEAALRKNFDKNGIRKELKT